MRNKIQDIVRFATDCKTDAMRWNMPDELQDEYPWPFIEKVTTWIEKYVSASGGEKADQTEVGNHVQSMYIAYHWCKFKKIYSMNSTFARYLAETEDAPISVNIIRRLPFRSFALTFDDDKKIIDLFPQVFSSVECLLVTVGIEAETDVYISIALVGTSARGKRIVATGITSMKDGDCYETALRDGDKILYTGSLEGARMEWRPVYRLALNACQYFCASNAEVRDVKISKNKKPKVTVNGKEKPVAVSMSEVGFRIGKRFEAMYAQREEPEQRSDERSWTPKRPHVRRAHWHHYWTGPGRTVLELRWLEPVFVMGDSDRVDAVVHEVGRENAS